MMYSSGLELCAYIDEMIDKREILITESTTYYTSMVDFVGDNMRITKTCPTLAYNVFVGGISPDGMLSLRRNDIEIFVTINGDKFDITISSENCSTIPLTDMSIIQEKVEEIICMYKLGEFHTRQISLYEQIIAAKL